MLQHPDEARNPKGTAIIAELGLEQYACFQGEDFSQHAGLNEILKKDFGKIAVLYPAEGAEVLTRSADSDGTIKRLIVIDATWPKARKIWQLNPQLHPLPCYRCEPGMDSNYRIRKAPSEGQLSTLESIVWTLSVLEGDAQRYQPLLDLFAQMIDFQIKNMGEETYKRNYLKKHDGKS